MHNIDAYGDLTAEERATLLRVFRKDEEVRSQEREFISEVKYMLGEIEKTTLSEAEEIAKKNVCARCSQYFSAFYLLFLPFKQCGTCNKRICKSCICEGTENSPICKYCDLRHKLKCISGTWFFGPNGREKRRESMKDRFSGPIVQQHSISFDSPEVFQLNVRSESMDNDIIIPEIPKSKPYSLSQTNIPQTVSLESKNDIIAESYMSKESSMPKESSIEVQKPKIKPCNENDYKYEEKIEKKVKKKIDIKSEHTTVKEIESTKLNAASQQIDESKHKEPENARNLTCNVPIVIIEEKKLEEEKATAKDESGPLEKTKKNKKICEADKTEIQSNCTPIKTFLSIDNVNYNGLLHGMVKVEPYNDQFLIKIKIVEAVDLVPLNHSTTISSYVVCQAKSHATIIFKKKTSKINDCSAPVWGETFEFAYASRDLNNLMIFLLVKKPREKSIKSILKKEESENLIYGSVRIGNAAYLTNEEINTWIELNKNIMNNVTDWVEFKISLNKISTQPTSSTQNMAYSSCTLNVNDSHHQKEPSPPSVEDTTSLYSISTGYCGQGKICGALNIYLKYDNKNKCLTVKVLTAEGLNLPIKLANSTKIFATCKLVPKSSENEKKVTVKSKDINRPEFYSTFLLIIDPKQINDTYVIVDLYRTEKILSKVFLGQVSIPIGSILCDKPQEIIEGFSNSYCLSKHIPNALYGFLGTIRVSIRYDPSSLDPRLGKLEVRILQGNQITFNRKDDPIETMVSCALLPDSDSKSIKRTKLSKKSHNPEWKYCTTYPEISFHDLQMYRALEIIIWTNNSAFVGGTRIGPRQTEYSYEIWQDSNKIESELWEEMIKKPKNWVFATIPLRYCMLSQILYPSLTTNVLNLFNVSMDRVARLFFDIKYSTQNQTSFHVYLQSVEGIAIEYEKIYCKILVYSKGVVQKSLTKYVESINDHEWNNRLQIDIPEQIETSAIEFRIKSHPNSQEVFTKGGVIFGRVLLSKASSTNEWNLPGQEEIEFFNQLIKSPDRDFSAQLPINAYSKPKKIKRKESNKRLDILKSEAKNNEKKLVRPESLVEAEYKVTQLYSLKKVKPIFRRMTTVDSGNSTQPKDNIPVESRIGIHIRSMDEFPFPEHNEIESKTTAQIEKFEKLQASQIMINKTDIDIKNAESAKVFTMVGKLVEESKILQSIEKDLPPSTPKVSVSPSGSPLSGVTTYTRVKSQSPETLSTCITTKTTSEDEQKVQYPIRKIEQHEPAIVHIPNQDKTTPGFESNPKIDQKMEPNAPSLKIDESPKDEKNDNKSGKVISEIKLPIQEVKCQVQEEKLDTDNFSKETISFKSVSDERTNENRMDQEIIKLKENETIEVGPVLVLKPSVTAENQPIIETKFKKLPEKIEHCSEVEKALPMKSLQSKNFQDKGSEAVSNLDLSTQTSSENISENNKKADSTIKPRKSMKFSTLLKRAKDRSGEVSDTTSQEIKTRPSVGLMNRNSIISMSNKSLAGLSETVSVMLGTEISGKILIRLEYKKSEHILIITLKNGVGITPHDPKKNKNDTFSRINIFPDKSKNAEFKTKVVKGTLDPVWDESFQYSVNESDVKLRKIIINTYHKAFAKNTFLGQIIIHMDKTYDKLKAESFVEQWYNLYEKVKLSEISSENLNTLGKLELKITITDITPSTSKKKGGPDAILQIKEIKATGISLSQTILKAICKIYLLSDKSHEDKKSTKPVENVSGTFSFNQTIDFNVQKEILPDCGIFFKMCDAKKTLHAFSTAKLNNGSKKFPWQDADEEGTKIWQQIISLDNITKDFKITLKPTDQF